MHSDRLVLESFATLAAHRGQAGLEAAVELLEETQRWPESELLQQQLLLAGRLIAHARKSVPWYRERLAHTASAPLTLDRFHELPILSRADLLDHRQELKSSETLPGHRTVREANSSGSTGRQVTVEIDSASAAVTRVIALRDHAWHGRELTCKAAGIRAIVSGASAPLGRHVPRWAPSPRSGPLALLDVHTPVRAQLEWIEREAPAYLATYASNAAALVEAGERHGVSLPSLRELGTFGEVLPDGLRDAAMRVWNVPVVDSYSCVELGYLALQCPKGTTYHVQSESVLLELLRDDATPCAPGEVWRVVVTALHAVVMPLIRYETGDYAMAGEPCRCGRRLPVIERILGRARNMMVLPAGDVLWPRYASNILGKLFPLRQFRLVQTSLRELVLEIVPARPLSVDEERGLKSLVVETLGHPFELELRTVDDIPRSPSGKFEDFVCRVPRTSLTARSG